MKVWQQDWSSKWAVYSPDKIALKEHETSISLTYSELHKLGNRVARYLCDEIKLQKGDRIAIIAENSIEHFILFAAAQKTGIILVPINHRLTAAEIEYLLVTSTPKLILYDENHKDVVLKTSYVQSHEARLYVLHELQSYFDKQYLEQRDETFTIRPLEEDDPIFILFTSGTTGFPKGAMYTHKMLFWNSFNTAMSLIIDTETRSMNCMPLFHTGGWNVLATPILHHGGSLVLIRDFNATTILDIIENEKLTIFMGVPTMLKMMANEAAFDNTDYTSLHYVIVGGEAMPIPLIEKWSEQGVSIRQGYGLTEVGPNLTSLHQDDAIRKKGSIGRPNFYVETKIIDEQGNEAAANQRGELLLKGPMITPGYWNNNEETAQSIKNGWFHTGDVVIRDDEDYLYVVDRVKNMYISGGENVYPAEIERVLQAHEEIIESVVINVPHEKWGEVGKAFVVAKNNKLTAKEIVDYCQTKLAKFKIPKHIAFVKEIPKNDTGKINRRALKNIKN